MVFCGDLFPFFTEMHDLSIKPFYILLIVKEIVFCFVYGPLTVMQPVSLFG